MKLCNAAILLLFFSKLYSQEINWVQTNNWKLYDTHGLRGYDFTPEKLSRIKNETLNIDSIRNFLSSVSIIPSNNTPVWMGHYIVSCQTQSGVIKILYVSTYGGFFYDASEKKYYQLQADETKEWLDYLADKEAEIQSK